MKKPLLICFIFTFINVNQALAKDFNEELTTCYLTKDNTKRLACYDKVIADDVKYYQNEQKKASLVKYKNMDLLDLKTDIKSLEGQKVSVIGQVQMMGELVILKESPMDMTPIMLDITKLPRDDRKQMLKSCAVICDNVRVNAVVHQGAMGGTLIADQVVWQ